MDKIVKYNQTKPVQRQVMRQNTQVSVQLAQGKTQQKQQVGQMQQVVQKNLQTQQMRQVIQQNLQTQQREKMEIYQRNMQMDQKIEAFNELINLDPYKMTKNLGLPSKEFYDEFKERLPLIESQSHKDQGRLREQNDEVINKVLNVSNNLSNVPNNCFSKHYVSNNFSTDELNVVDRLGGVFESLKKITNPFDKHGPMYLNSKKRIQNAQEKSEKALKIINSGEDKEERLKNIGKLKRYTKFLDGELFLLKKMNKGNLEPLNRQHIDIFADKKQLYFILKNPDKSIISCIGNKDNAKEEITLLYKPAINNNLDGVGHYQLEEDGKIIDLKSSGKNSCLYDIFSHITGKSIKEICEYTVVCPVDKVDMVKKDVAILYKEVHEDLFSGGMENLFTNLRNKVIDKFNSSEMVQLRSFKEIFTNKKVLSSDYKFKDPRRKELDLFITKHIVDIKKNENPLDKGNIGVTSLYNRTLDLNGVPLKKNESKVLIHGVYLRSKPHTDKEITNHELLISEYFAGNGNILGGILHGVNSLVTGSLSSFLNPLEVDTDRYV